MTEQVLRLTAVRNHYLDLIVIFDFYYSFISFFDKGIFQFYVHEDINRKNTLSVQIRRPVVGDDPE